MAGLSVEEAEAILSRSTSVMSGSSSDLDFERIARQGTWDWESAYWNRGTVGVWIRRVRKEMKRGMWWKRRGEAA